MSISKASLLSTLKKFRVQQDANNLTKFPVTVEKLQLANDGYVASYVVKQGGEQVGDTINIPKDYLVKSAELATVETDDTPYTGAKVGDKYIDFVINAKEGAGTESHIYLPVNSLVDTYTSGKGIEISSDNSVNAKIDAAQANGLTVSETGIALGLATADAAGAMSAADKAALDNLVESNDEQITDEEIAAIFAD